MTRLPLNRLSFAAKIIFLTSFIFLPNLGWAAEENQCIQCHSDLWEEMKMSVHSQNGIMCQDCHGGDPTKLDFDLAKAPETGFIGVPNKKQIVDKCGGCHASVETMNFYGIRTDQLARYQTSVHGKKLLIEGDNRVAACADCHGSHKILPISDPNSQVYPLNVPKTCNQCHGDQALMDQYQLPSDIFKIYQNSVHGKALFEKKDLSAATCASCHGSHGAMPPGVKHISEACGKCHINEKKFFLESVHAPLAQEGKFSECISCHGNHGVKHATKTLYFETCGNCHKESAAVALGEKLYQLLNASENDMREASALVKRSAIEGIFVEEEMGALEETKTNEIAMAPLQHTLSLKRITELYGKLTESVNYIKTSVKGKRQALKWRKLALIPVWVFVIFMAIALWTKYKRLKEKGH